MKSWRISRPWDSASSVSPAAASPTVIRSWLGHVSLDTTSHYGEANRETKCKALERVGAPATDGKPPSWKRDASVLSWLDLL